MKHNELHTVPKDKKRRRCKPLSPDMKRKVWAPLSHDNNLGMGWDAGYAYRPQRYNEEYGAVAITIPLDDPTTGRRPRDKGYRE